MPNRSAVATTQPDGTNHHYRRRETATQRAEFPAASLFAGEGVDISRRKRGFAQCEKEMGTIRVDASPWKPRAAGRAAIHKWDAYNFSIGHFYEANGLRTLTVPYVTPLLRSSLYRVFTPASTHAARSMLSKCDKLNRWLRSRAARSVLIVGKTTGKERMNRLR